ncbi:MAG: hypothetical protein JXR78_07420 [Victivallales bacterium]|nr:hypothetical protein [Victivallales bacterium]
MKQIIILIVLVIFALVYFLWPKSKPEISRLDKASAAESGMALNAAEKAYQAFSENGMEKLRPLMIKLDGHGYGDQEKILDQIKSPRFDRAKVWQPRFDKNLFYVHVPTASGENLIMAFIRQQNNELKLASVSRDAR